MSEKKIINILIVDNEPENILAVENLFENSDLNIVKAASGEKAVDLMLEQDFALVFLNAVMQKTEGFDTAKSMRRSERTRHIPIILLIPAGIEKEFTLKDYRSGVVDYLYKPIDPVVLKSKVNVFIELYTQKELLNKQTAMLLRKDEELRELRGQLEELKRKLEEHSFYDSLTQLPNRRRFKEFLNLEWRRCIRTGGVVSLVMIEIDFFKQFIDHYGRQAGDDCLRKVAEALADSAKRVPDFVVHYSGGNFAVVLPETNNDAGVFVAERVRENIELLNIPHWQSPAANHVTISLGIASIVPSTDSSPSDLIDAANTFLDEAKKWGGNQVRTLEPLI